MLLVHFESWQPASVVRGCCSHRLCLLWYFVLISFKGVQLSQSGRAVLKFMQGEQLPSVVRLRFGQERFALFSVQSAVHHLAQICCPPFTVGNGNSYKRTLQY